jgi:hypothetical protein
MKIYRSLIFMDGWLSYTLGYNSEATPSDVKVSLTLSYAANYTDVGRPLAVRTSRSW